MYAVKKKEKRMGKEHDATGKKSNTVRSFCGMDRSIPNTNGKPWETGRTYKAETDTNRIFRAFLGYGYPPLCLCDSSPDESEYYAAVQSAVIDNKCDTIASNEIVLEKKLNGTEMRMSS
jgi:hypothetical protein